MGLVSTCMECGNEWEQLHPIMCPMCGNGDFCTEIEYMYNEFNLDECLELNKSGYDVLCNADTRKLLFIKE